MGCNTQIRPMIAFLFRLVRAVRSRRTDRLKCTHNVFLSLSLSLSLHFLFVWKSCHLRVPSDYVLYKHSCVYLPIGPIFQLISTLYFNFIRLVVQFLWQKQLYIARVFVTLLKTRFTEADVYTNFSTGDRKLFPFLAKLSFDSIFHVSRFLFVFLCYL